MVAIRSEWRADAFIRRKISDDLPFLRGIADWDRDGHQDLVARDSANLLWLYPGESRRGYSNQSRVQIGNGWGGYTFAGIADWDRDGHQDLVARNSANQLILYPGESRRGYSNQSPVQIGNGW